VPDYMIKGGTIYRLITDHLGNPRLVMDTVTGQIVQRIDYDEFGNVLLDTNSGFPAVRFCGGLYDQQTKLTRFGRRGLRRRDGALDGTGSDRVCGP